MEDCVALYVNVGDKHGNTYNNVFTRWIANLVVRATETRRGHAVIVPSSSGDHGRESVEDARQRAEEGEDAAPRYVDWPLHLFCRMEVRIRTADD